MKIKPGVRIPYSVAIPIALQAIEPILAKYHQELVVTSYEDGTHSKGSLHYVGLAVDVRTWTLSNPDECIAAMKAALGDDFDVVLEKDHIHIEFQPK